MSHLLSSCHKLPFLRTPLLLALMICLPLSSPAALAQVDDKNQKKQPTLLALAIHEYESLEFGKVVAGGGNRGKVTIDAVDGSKKVTHGVADLGGHHSPAKFLITGQPNAHFVINIRNRGPLTASNRKTKGKNTKNKLKNLKSHPDKFGRLGADGKAWVMVGGEIALPAHSGSGKYTGRFAVDVDYRYAKGK